MKARGALPVELCMCVSTGVKTRSKSGRPVRVDLKVDLHTSLHQHTLEALLSLPESTLQVRHSLACGTVSPQRQQLCTGVAMRSNSIGVLLCRMHGYFWNQCSRVVIPFGVMTSRHVDH